MNTPIPVWFAGSNTALNPFVLFYSLVNILIPLVIVVLLIWYLKKQNDDRKQLINKLDSLIELLQPKKNNED